MERAKLHGYLPRFPWALRAGKERDADTGHVHAMWGLGTREDVGWKRKEPRRAYQVYLFAWADYSSQQLIGPAWLPRPLHQGYLAVARQSIRVERMKEQTRIIGFLEAVALVVGRGFEGSLAVFVHSAGHRGATRRGGGRVKREPGEGEAPGLPAVGRP